MAEVSAITSDDDWFCNTDLSLVATIYQKTSAGVLTTTPQDITGYALSWLLKRRQGDTDAAAMLTKTTSAGIALTTPLSGICTITIEDTDTVSLQPGVYWHELKRTDAGSETVLLYGRAVLRRAIHAS